MLKKWWILALICALAAVTVAGCGEKASPTPAMGGFSEADMVFATGGKEYKIKQDSAALLKALGEDCETYEAISCLFDGTDKSFDYGGVLVSTYPIDGKDVIEEITVFSDAYPTAKGVKVGDDKSAVLAAYGEGGVLDGDILTYMLTDASDSPRLYFQIDANDKVTLISYFGGTGL